ncbi:MAG: hypothetical protein H6Q52_115 [Deltaproteobacteria bacterium]|nr:hypothetical protein [Deltaproteobacteria bacterium]
MLLFGALSIADGDTPQKTGAGAAVFAWNQNAVWQALEARFRDVRSAGCRGAAAEIEKRFQEGNRQFSLMSGSQLKPTDHLFDAVEANLFGLGPLMAACPERVPEYAKLIASVRNVLKRQSIAWDVKDQQVRDRLYRIIYGGRIALEEVTLQAPKDSLPTILHGTKEPSKTPSFVYAGIELHSGDILVSRGGAPTSALIARGNDYPGNFSHVALLYIDETTNKASIIEAHIERGVVITTVDEYIKDVKLRIMVLRVRADHPLLQKDPMLPHRAAKMAYEEAGKGHIRYDFAMDFKDPSERFCSEVASQAYSSLGIDLWSIRTTMSSVGVVNWLSDFGVRNFITQAPADLEYDPQLSVVAEGRDRETLWQAHVDDAVIDAMLEGANRGERFACPLYRLVPAWLAKTYSGILNFFGKVGPVPEGMNARVAVKAMELEKKHKRLKQQVLASATLFEEKNGYRPPYWELVRMAERANEESIR